MRITLALAVSLCVLASGPIVPAAENVTYTLAREFSGSLSDEFLCGFALNNKNEIAVFTRGPELHRYTISRSDGDDYSTWTTVFTCLKSSDRFCMTPRFDLCAIGLNDEGWIVASASDGLGPQGAFFFPPDFDPGSDTPAFVVGGGVQTWSSDFRLDAQGKLGFSEFTNPGMRVGTVDWSGAREFSTTGAWSFGTSQLGGATINSKGKVADMGLGVDGSFVAMVDWDPELPFNEFFDLRLSGTGIGPAESWRSPFRTVGLNDAGYAGIVTGMPGGTAPFRAVVLTPPESPRESATIVAEESGVGYSFVQGTYPILEPWLSECNALLYGVREGIGADSLWVSSFQGVGQPPIPVYREGDILPAQGGVAGGVLAASHQGSSRVYLNDRGRIAFAARYGSPLKWGIFVAEMRPGVLPDKPVLPDATQFTPFGFRFTGCGCNSIGGSSRRGIIPCFREAEFYPPGTTLPVQPVCYFDPPIAVGYRFESDPNTLPFRSITVPISLAGGDTDFMIEVDGAPPTPIGVGSEFDFASIGFPSGVFAFRVTGINPAEAISPDDPTAFVAGLRWEGPADAEVSFTMRPIVIDFDDDDSDGVINNDDNCPAAPNPTQVDSDANGVGDACDSPAKPGEASDLLIVGHDRTTGELGLTFAPACEASNYDVIFGDLASVHNLAWNDAACDIGASGPSGIVSPGLGDVFFIVAAHDGTDAGPYGARSDGSPRPRLEGACGRTLAAFGSECSRSK